MRVRAITNSCLAPHGQYPLLLAYRTSCIRLAKYRHARSKQKLKLPRVRDYHVPGTHTHTHFAKFNRTGPGNMSLISSRVCRSSTASICFMGASDNYEYRREKVGPSHKFDQLGRFVCIRVGSTMTCVPHDADVTHLLNVRKDGLWIKSKVIKHVARSTVKHFLFAFISPNYVSTVDLHLLSQSTMHMLSKSSREPFLSYLGSQ